MKLNIHIFRPFSIFAAMLVALPLTAGNAKFQNNATDMIQNLETRAREVRQQAGVLQTFTRFPDLNSNVSHDGKLIRIKEDVNAMAEIVEKLQQNRAEAADWQVQFVNHLLPRMESLASNTEQAIKFVNQKPNQLFNPNYDAYVDEIYQRSSSIVRITDSFLDWANTHSELESVTESRNDAVNESQARTVSAIGPTYR